MHYIIGLGNPDQQYVETRHNIGREIVEKFAQKNSFPEFAYDKKYNALISVSELVIIKENKKRADKKTVTLILPQTYMNKSGNALKKIISSSKKAESATVVYDDLDLAVGKTKMNFNRSSGGHKGLESIIKSLKTKKFNRIRIGISKATPMGKVRKPKGEEEVVKHVLGKFSPKERELLKKITPKVLKSLKVFIFDGKEKATGFLNT